MNCFVVVWDYIYYCYFLGRTVKLQACTMRSCSRDGAHACTQSGAQLGVLILYLKTFP